MVQNVFGADGDYCKGWTPGRQGPERRPVERGRISVYMRILGIREMSEIKEPYLELDGQVSLSKSVAGAKCKGQCKRR